MYYWNIIRILLKKKKIITKILILANFLRYFKYSKNIKNSEYQTPSIPNNIQSKIPRIFQICFLISRSTTKEKIQKFFSRIYKISHFQCVSTIANTLVSSVRKRTIRHQNVYSPLYHVTPACNLWQSFTRAYYAPYISPIFLEPRFSTIGSIRTQLYLERSSFLFFNPPFGF